MTLAKLVTRLTTDISQYRKGLTKAQSVARSSVKGIGSALKAIKKTVKSAILPVAAIDLCEAAPSIPGEGQMGISYAIAHLHPAAYFIFFLIFRVPKYKKNIKIRVTNTYLVYQYLFEFLIPVSFVLLH